MSCDDVGSFLAEQPGPIPWQLPDGGRGSFHPLSLFLGEGANPLEVAVATAASRPNVSDVRQLWKRRKANRPAPLMLVVLRPGPDGLLATVCGPAGEDPPVASDRDCGQIERIAAQALAEPDRNAAIRFLADVLSRSDERLPGIRNAGMFATHELEVGVPSRADWDAMAASGRKLLAERGQSLVQALGFDIATLGATTSVLRVKDTGVRRAVAVFLDENETPEGAAVRFDGVSPVSYALAQADAEGLPYVVLTRGNQIRVYAASKHTGVGRRGRAETFIEANLALLPDDRAGYVPLLFGAEALRPGGSFEEILDRSKDFATGLGERLRERVYNKVVPQLAKVVAAHHHTTGAVTEQELADLYETGMVILFRLLFVAYAEDKDLLPYRSNGLYQRNALKTLARDLAELANAGTFDPDPVATSYWTQVRSLWRAVDTGNRDWAVPAYNGGMFSDDPAISPAGARIAGLSLSNAEIGPALLDLLVDTDSDGVYGPVDFRSLSVREFGTIYEGLLESNLSVAASDLAVAEDGTFLPATGDMDVAVASGDIYLHNRSGARKATGSYFTKHFAVEHLLEHALEPVLDDHLQRLRNLLDAGEDGAAADAFFDFRVADIAMGSGHFLVAAIDHIEARLSNFLARHPIPGVVAELARLRRSAVENLGEVAGAYELEDSSLLRRQIARRCIYGVDINRIAVQLARLGIWIHTFVPGLPLSFLDHNLIHGNSLTGIGTLNEALDDLIPDVDQPSLFRTRIESWLRNAEAALKRLARVSDASAAEIREARKAHADALEAVETARKLFDLLIAVRLEEATPFLDLSDETVNEHPNLEQAEMLVKQLQALHFPIVFPEVFLRDQPGFDCIVGNPPWDKVRFEAQQFWVTREPGLNALPATARDRRIDELRAERPGEAAIEDRERRERERLQKFFKAAFHSQGSGHLDYAKLFVERAKSLLKDEGTLGYVLPRQLLVLGGWGKLRDLLLEESALLMFQTRNKGGWMFDDVHHSYMVVLLVRTPAPADESGVRIWGAAKNLHDLVRTRQDPGLWLSRAELEELSDSLVVPWFNSLDEVPIFDRIRKEPRLSSGEGWISGIHDARWDFRGTGRHRSLTSDNDAPEAWRILMARHVDAFGINQEKDFRRFIRQPSALVALGLGVTWDDGGDVVLGGDHPTIVFRHPSINDNARTMIAAALPEAGFLPNAGYVHALRTQLETPPQDLLALLGYLNSYTCDWWVRRFVDRHVTAPVVNNLPLPPWDDEDRVEASRLTAELLVRGGTATLPGGARLESDPDLEPLGRDQLLSALEVLVARAFGLTSEETSLLLEDFSDKGCPPQLRTLILEEVS